MIRVIPERIVSDIPVHVLIIPVHVPMPVHIPVHIPVILIRVLVLGFIFSFCAPRSKLLHNGFIH